MKTLDEVIAMVEHCSLPMPNSICATCPSKQRASDCHLYTDVLHYLKVLKDILDPPKVKKNSHEITCPQCQSKIAILLPESNEPLTWSELKQMEGKPVWVEGEHGCIWNQKAWSLIRLDPENDDIVICISTDGNMHYEYAIGKEDYGTDWQAYRKERE